MEKKKSGLATAGLVLGIIGICLSFIPIVNNAAFVLGVLALIFGIIPLCKKASVGKAVTALILGVLSVAITLVMQASLSNAIDDAFDELDKELSSMTGENTDEILANSLDISMGKFQVAEGDFLDETKLVVTLKNKSSEKQSFMVQVEAVDASGSRINSDYIYANDLNAGQSQEFEIFTLISSDEIEKMKKASFNIVEASMY